MIQTGTVVYVSDKTGIVCGQCIKVLGGAKQRIAFVGDLILISVMETNLARLKRLKLIRRKKFWRGTLHRALVVRSKTPYLRLTGLFVRFDVNSVVVVTKRRIPVSNRVEGPILRELCMQLPSLGCVTHYMF